MKDDIADESHLRENLEKMGIIRRNIKKERLIDRCGGQSHLAQAVNKSNNNKQTRFEVKKRERDELVMQEGNDKMTNLMIDRLIY